VQIVCPALLMKLKKKEEEKKHTHKEKLFIKKKKSNLCHAKQINSVVISAAFFGL
jgi:hypothetical protein